MNAELAHGGRHVRLVNYPRIDGETRQLIVDGNHGTRANIRRGDTSVDSDLERLKAGLQRDGWGTIGKI